MADRRTELPEGSFLIQPIKTWGGMLSILSVVAILVTAINQSISWFDANVQRVEATKVQLEQVRAEFRVEHDKLKLEDQRREMDNRRRDAWALVNQLEIKALVIQFRLNDCQIKNDEKKPTPLEKQICDQYRQEKEDATNRYKEAWREAMAIGKEKPN